MLHRRSILALLSIILALAFVGGRTITGKAAPARPPVVKPQAISEADRLLVHFIKTRKMADAILLDLGGTEVLIDAGYPDSGVAEYLRDFVDGPLEAIIATHPHADHIGGMAKVLKSCDVREIWTNGDDRKLDPEVVSRSPKPLTDYEHINQVFKNQTEAEGCAVRVALRGQIIRVGSLSFKVIHPEKKYSRGSFRDIRSAYQNMNNDSIVLRLEYGEVSFLIAGDILKKAESEILKAGLNVRADILKVGHHGSIMGSSKEFLKRVKPKVAVYMASGKQPAHGQLKPHPDTVAVIKESGARVYGKGQHGTIIISTDGKTYSVATGESHAIEVHSPRSNQ